MLPSNLCRGKIMSLKLINFETSALCFARLFCVTALAIVCFTGLFVLKNKYYMNGKGLHRWLASHSARLENCNCKLLI